MRGRKYWLFLIVPFLAAILLLMWQIGNMTAEIRSENRVWRVQAELSDREITEEMLRSMGKFPGLLKLWTVFEAEVAVSVKEYTGTVSLQGVEFGEYPLTVVKSAGKKEMGSVPLLAAGENFFELLQDSGGNSVSKRQKEILRENLGALEVQLQVGTTENGYKNGGEFLGTVKEEGLYMDQEQMRQWLGNQGLPPRIGKVCMEIRGRMSMEKIQQCLEEAGFTVEIAEVSRN